MSVSEVAASTTAALRAIRTALQHIPLCPENRWLLLTDSYSAVSDLRRGLSANNYLLRSIFHLAGLPASRGRHLRVRWVFSHAGASGNEETDRLPVRALHFSSQAITVLLQSRLSSFISSSIVTQDLCPYAAAGTQPSTALTRGPCRPRALGCFTVSVLNMHFPTLIFFASVKWTVRTACTETLVRQWAAC